MEPPLHPAIVHVPVGLAIVMPLLTVGLTLALWRKWFTRRAWIVVVTLQAILFAGALAGMKTGENEEERVEDVVAERFIEEHEEKAEVFLWASGATLALAAGVLLIPAESAALVAGAAVTALATLIVAGSAYTTGHAGGELVYVHGAASAYTGGAAASPERDEGGERMRRGRDDDD